MAHTTFVLLIDKASAGTDHVRRALSVPEGQIRVQCLDDVSTALARIAGGGVDVAVIRLRPSGDPAEAALDGFLKLRAGAPQIPIVLVCDLLHEALGQSAVQQGASHYVLNETCEAELPKAVTAIMASAPRAMVLLQDRSAHLDPGGQPKGSPRSGRVLLFMGAKGGVGTTTAALNVASVLAEERSVILAEFHSVLGTLPDHFLRHRSILDFGRLLRTGQSAIDAAEAEACLWPCTTIPGLRVLFGPRKVDHPVSIEPEDVRAMLAVLRSLADCVVVDLPSSLSKTTLTVMEDSDLMTLVVERDPVCVQSAKRILQTMDAWALAKIATGIAIVNRAALALPRPIAEIEHELSVPLFGIIPPAPDICAAAQNARAPVVLFDAESLPAIAFRDLSKAISGYIPDIRRGRPPVVSTPRLTAVVAR